MTPITTTRTLTTGDLDGDWQIVAEGERGIWEWMPEWDRMALTWFWERVHAGSVYACQGRTPGYAQDHYTLYAKLARHVVQRRAA